MALFYGVVSASFAFADFLTRGFDVFGTDFVKTGAFDRCCCARARRRCSWSATTFASAASGGWRRRSWPSRRQRQPRLPLGPGAGRLALWAVVGGVALFSGLFVLQATLAFWTVESLEVANVLTYGGVQAASSP